MTVPTKKYAKLENGAAVVANHELAPAERPGPANVTGHVWATVQTGMVAHRMHLTPSDARTLAAALVAMADSLG